MAHCAFQGTKQCEMLMAVTCISLWLPESALYAAEFSYTHYKMGLYNVLADKVFSAFFIQHFSFVNRDLQK